MPNRFERQSFMIFEVSDRLRRFEYAVRISRQLCDMCMRDKKNRPFDYSKFRSLDACIGTYTRAVRPHFKLNYLEDRQRFHILLKHIATFNDVQALPVLQVIQFEVRPDCSSIGSNA